MSHQINPAYFPSTNFSLSDGINHDFWPLLDVNRLQHFQETRPSCFEDMMGALQNSKDVDRDNLSWWPQLIFPIPLYVDPRDPDAFYMWPLEALKLLQDATVGYNIGYALQILVSMDDKTLKIILSRRPGLPIERIYWLKAFAILFDVVTNIPGVEADEEARGLCSRFLTEGWAKVRVDMKEIREYWPPVESDPSGELFFEDGVWIYPKTLLALQRRQSQPEMSPFRKGMRKDMDDVAQKRRAQHEMLERDGKRKAEFGPREGAAWIAENEKEKKASNDLALEWKSAIQALQNEVHLDPSQAEHWPVDLVFP